MVNGGCIRVPTEFKQIKLSSTVTIGRYLEMADRGDVGRHRMANFIRARLSERYIAPLRAVPRKKKNGFLIMAAACFLIETLESFYRGWTTTNGTMARCDILDPCKPTDSRKRISNSELAFCYFFEREAAFATFRDVARSFYKGVRCGIFHQGETTEGWRIRRYGDLFEKDNFGARINANKFLEELQLSLNAYSDKLREANWDQDIIWKHFRTKMDSVIEHCKSGSTC
jgi:hypothetical protein